jgi:hypothetical protein
MKVNTHPSNPGLKPIKSNATRPFEQVTVDFITHLPVSNGFDSVMVVVDHGLSKGVVYVPCTAKIDAIGTAQKFIDHVWKRFGLPSIIISDRGPQFASKVFQELCNAIKIKHRMSTAYHPQTDGETERVNQELETYLRIFCGTEPRNWSTYLPMAEFAHNNRAHEVSRMTPFQIIYGTEITGIPTAFPTIKAPAVEQRLTEITKIRHEALAAHELARQLVMRRNKGTYKPFKLGDSVWLDSRHLNIPYGSNKLKPKRVGPFKIVKTLGEPGKEVLYELDLPHQWRCHPVFNTVLLSPYRETGEHGPNYLKPPPDLINGENEYEVESIIAHRKKGTSYQYLIRWKGYGSNDDTWEPASNLSNAEEILDEYKTTYSLEDPIIPKSKASLLSHRSRKHHKHSTRKS